MTLSIANIDYQRLLRLRAKGGMKKKNDRSVRFYDNIHLSCSFFREHTFFIFYTPPSLQSQQKNNNNDVSSLMAIS